MPTRTPTTTKTTTNKPGKANKGSKQISTKPTNQGHVDNGQQTQVVSAKPVVQDTEPRGPAVYPTKEWRDKGYKYQSEMCYGENAITVEQSQAMLGWTPVKASEGYHFRDREGNYIFCRNNRTNRPIDWGVVDMLVQAHLLREWNFNGEPILIGTHESVLNGQKSMISHVFAEQERKKDAKGARKYVQYWDGPITMEKAVTFGISELDRVVNTIDTAQPRSLPDVLYRSRYLQSLAPKARLLAAKIAGFCIKTIWSRTGVGSAAFELMPTHDAMLAFLERHPRILDAVRWIAAENEAKIKFTNSDGQERSRGKVDIIIEPSRAAAVLYLMGMSATASTVYRYAKPLPSESVADDSNWDAAEDFWTGLLTDGSGEFEPVRFALGDLVNKNSTARATADEKITVLWKAWNQFVNRKRGFSFNPQGLRPRYNVYRDEHGNEERQLIKEWCFGGVDILPKIQADKAASDKEKADKTVTSDNGTDTSKVITGTKTRKSKATKPPTSSEERDEELEDGVINTDSNGDPDDPSNDPGYDEDAPGPLGANQMLARDGDIVVRDPTPEEIRAMLGKNGANEDETPEQERLRRERVERDAAKMAQAEKSSASKVKVRELLDVPQKSGKH